MKRIIAIVIFFVLFLLILTENSYSQWRLVKHFNKPFKYYQGTAHQSATIRFTKFNEWGIGFAGTSPGPENPDGGLWRSIDSGATWHLTRRNKHPGLEGLYCTNITFKDSLTGWTVTSYSEWTPSAAMIILQTTDGGSEWDVVYANGGLRNGAYGIYYAHDIDFLFCSTWDAVDGGLLSSIDAGKTWITAVTSHGLNGFTGNDSVIIVPGIGFPLVRSSDKGKTWQDVFMPNGETVDCWQPYADNKRNLWYLGEQGDGNAPSPSSFYASTDLGESWKLMHKFDYYYYADFDGNSFDNCKGAVNGAVSGDDSGYVYLQYINGGMIRSVDTGKTWTSICGPSNKWDTRFTIFKNTIFAGDTNGIWALDLLTPQGIQIPQSVSMPGSNCGSTRSPVYFTSTYFCSGSVLLDSISVTGSSAFTAVPGYRRGEIAGKDSVFIDYTPQTPSDTGYVIFHFTENGIQRDTTVSIIGTIISPHQDIILTPQLTGNGESAGTEVTCNVMSSNRITNKGLNTISFELLYDSDLLDVKSVISSVGTVTFTPPTVTITGSNLTIDSLLPLVQIQFATYLTDTTSSNIEIANILLNGGDIDYKNCTLSATGNNITFTQSSLCGDSILRAFLRTSKTSLEITSIRPNPTNANISVTFESFADDKAELQLVDELGKVVYEETLATKRGVNEHSVVIPKHWSGTFYLRLQMGKDVVTGKFVKQ